LACALWPFFPRCFSSPPRRCTPLKICARGQRIVIVLLDRTGSMAARFRDPETRIALTRLQHSWRYLNRDLREELGKGRRMSIYFLPFSASRPTRAIHSRNPRGSPRRVIPEIERRSRRSSAASRPTARRTSSGPWTALAELLES